jgi:hypothetical protein
MKTFAITVSALALLSGMLVQGSFGHAIIVMSSILFMGVPLALFLALWLLIGLKRTRGIPSGWRTTTTISAVIGGGLILSFGTGSLIHHWEIRKVRQFVEATIPSLDNYHHKNGTYPSGLAELGISSVPKILRNSSGYSSTRDTFTFVYWDSAEMMGGYEFDSSKRKWTCFD